MAIKREEALKHAQTNIEERLQAAEKIIDQKIRSFYRGDQVDVPRRDLGLTDPELELLTKRYEEAGWNVRSGWSGTRDDGYSVLVLY